MSNYNNSTDPFSAASNSEVFVFPVPLILLRNSTEGFQICSEDQQFSSCNKFFFPT